MSFDADSIQFYEAAGGVATQFGVMIPPGGRVFYVSSVDRPEQWFRKGGMFRTLAAALTKCTAGRGDTIFVLPGHTENVTDATMLTNLVAGTRIIGLGSVYQDDAPTFTWTNTAGQWAITAKNVLLRNLRLQMNGVNGVVKGIAVTAAGFSMIGCYLDVAAGAALKATIVCELGEGATDALIAANYVTGTETHNVTDGFKLVGSSAPNHRCRFIDNTMIASATAANGLIHVTTACKRLVFARNRIYNTHTASTACIAIDNVAADGMHWDNYLATVNDGVATAQGIVFGAGALLRGFNSQSCDEPKKSGVLTPGVVAT